MCLPRNYSSAAGTVIYHHTGASTTRDAATTTPFSLLFTRPRSGSLSAPPLVRSPHLFRRRYFSTAAMSLLTVASTRAAAVRPLRAAAASDEAAMPAALPAGRRPVKVILPKKKPQKWSTGMAPGEYGGDPATVKPRKYWWGKEDLDPVGNTNDFIWNKDFLPYMERVISNGGADAAPAITRLAPVPRLPSLTHVSSVGLLVLVRLIDRLN
jgi:hypothetical protein